MQEKIDSSLPKSLLFILLTLSFIWFKSSLTKILSNSFPDSLGMILTKFAGKNPNLWYKNFLTSIAIPNAKILGTVIMWSELLAGITMIVAAFYFLLIKKRSKTITIFLLVGLIISIMLNMNFYLASSWTSVSTESLNLLMLIIESIILISVIQKSRNQKI